MTVIAGDELDGEGTRAQARRYNSLSNLDFRRPCDAPEETPERTAGFSSDDHKDLCYCARGNYM